MVSGYSFLWVANQPALDFVNTELLQAGERVDLLQDFEAVVHWLGGARLLAGETPASALAHFQQARDRTKLVDEAREMRGALRQLIEQRIAGKRASTALLNQINAYLELDAGHARLTTTSSGVVRRFERQLRAPRQLLQPLASAAAELLCDIEPARIKPCANHACILYFLDTSKNQTRRWCSMELCGNRTKVAAHYRRRREE
jgi:predicted RNA-binding Zn ribbon-like protein